MSITNAIILRVYSAVVGSFVKWIAGGSKNEWEQLRKIERLIEVVEK